MSADQLLISDPVPGVRLLTLNRPAKRNAIDRRLFGDLIAALRALDCQAEIRAAVITGAGPAFCAGVDRGDASDPELLAERRRTGVSPASVLRGLRTPVLGAINGSCYTGGLELALACDVLIAGESATFADTHVSLGLLPSWGGAALLPAAIGVRHAKRLALTGLPISAAEALTYGLVSQVVLDADLIPAALRLAEAVAAAPAQAVQRMSAMFDASEGTSREERLAAERRSLQSMPIDVSRVPSGARAQRSSLF